MSEDELRRVVQNYADARAIRDDAICRAAAGGMSLRTIGKIVGLSHTRIAQIIRAGN